MQGGSLCLAECIQKWGPQFSLSSALPSAVDLLLEAPPLAASASSAKALWPSSAISWQRKMPHLETVYIFPRNTYLLT